MKRSLLLALLLSGVSVRAEGPDDLYLESFSLVEQAEAMGRSGESRAAIDLLKQAETNLRKVQTSYPNWNTGMVKFRLNDVAERLAGLSGAAATPETKPKAVVAPNPQDEIKVLRSQVESLTAKLKEALDLQSSGLTAAERTRLEEKAAAQQKELDVLRAALEQEKAKVPAPAPAAAAVAPSEDIAAKAKSLAKENETLAQKVKQLSEELATASRTAAAERAALQKALAATEARPAPVAASAVDQVKVAELQARLAALEAKSVPYTSEELALFKAPPTRVVVLADTNTTAIKRTATQVPPGAGALVADANRAFSARNYALAEQKFGEALKQDEANVYLLGKLAAAQFEQKKTAEAEKTLERALKVDAEDPASLMLMGIVRFQQERYDEALTCLSRSAQLDPSNPDTQNYLGITLSQKGQRTAAEAALRKSIQLSPDNPAAHHNLAIIYVSQQPPFTELAWFHYRKSQALGHPKDAQLESLLEKAAAAK